MKSRFTRLQLSLGVLLVAGIALVAWKHEGILKRISNQRAESHLVRATTAGEDGDWKKSERLSLAAWQLKEGDPKILRQLYQSAKQLRSRHLLYAAGALFDHPEATAEDRLDVVYLHLQIGDLVRTKQLLGSLSQEELQMPDAMEAGVRFLLARGDLLRALALVEKLQQTRGNLEDTLLAARVIARIPTEGNKASSKAQAMIEALFFQNEEPRIALSALPILRSIPKSLWETSRFQMARQRIDSLREEGHPTSVDLYFLAAEIRITGASEHKDLILEELIASHRETNLAPLASWLLQMGEVDRVENLIPVDLAETSPALYLTLTRTLLIKKDWDAAEELLSRPQSQIPHTVVHAMRAVTAAGLGEHANSRDQWERALRQATLLSGRSGLLELARLADAAGEDDIRNNALTEALRRPSFVPMPAADVSFLFSHLAANDDAENLLVISRNLLTNEPGNPMLLNNVLWLELMMQKGSGEVRSEQIKSLVKKFPGISTLRATLTLALLEEEDLSGAQDSAEKMIARGDSDSFSQTDCAVIGLVGKKTGSATLASYSSGIEWKDMMDIERSFLKSALSTTEELQ